MANYFTDNADLQFYMERYIDWNRLYELLETVPHPDAPKSVDEAVSTYREVLELLGQFAADEVAPRAPIMDRKGTHMVDGKVVTSPEHEELFESFKEMGVYGSCMPRELGGMNLPGMVYLIMCELLARADVSTMTHFGFHAATALTMLSYSVHEGSTEFDGEGRIVSTRWKKEIDEILAGDTWGSMDLTEPNAGSDLAALRARAVKDKQGEWRLTGNKIFITSGHGNYHFVLAKTRDENSLSALSLFLVPLQLEKDGEVIRNAWVDRVEEKLGHHGSPTCSVIFDNSLGELVGKEGEGFKLMLKLMNHARLGVGVEGIGMCEAAYRAAKEYAEERTSMGSTLDKHPMIADYLDEMELTIKGIRAMAMEAAFAEEAKTHLELREHRLGSKVTLDPNTKREIRRLARRVRHLTPLLKYMATEEAVRFARLAMQIHGGNGYTTDYAPERLLRDALVLPVYEGTSQIQALMALKDNLGAITKNPQRFLREMARVRLRSLRASDAVERDVYRLKSMALSAQQHIMWRVAKDKFSDALGGPLDKAFERFAKNWDPKRDFAYGLLHAENLIRILCDVAVAEILWTQAKAFPERRELAERWIELVEPRVRYHYDLIHTKGDRLLRRLERSAANEQPPAKSA